MIYSVTDFCCIKANNLSELNLIIVLCSLLLECMIFLCTYISYLLRRKREYKDRNANLFLFLYFLSFEMNWAKSYFLLVYVSLRAAILAARASD